MLIGKRLNDRYKIKEVIGGGGMANVYLAHDIILDRDVAVKVLRLDFANDEEFIRRFRREAQSATSLDHPNIVSIYDIGEEDDIYYIVMEHVSGKTLKQYIQQYAPVEQYNTVEIMNQLTSAISHAHDNGIIHRDIKPQNILIDDYGTIKVTDFGIAMALSSTTITQTNSLLGSVHYLSPEQARGSLATKKSDVYALGIVMFELLTGRLPFSGESAVSIALKHLQSETPSPKRWNPSIPQSMENIILKSMTKDPFHRYSTVDEMQADLMTALDPSRKNEPKFIVPDEDEEATKAIPIIKGNLNNLHNDEETRIRTTEDKPNKNEDKKQSPKKKKKKKWVISLFILFFLLVGGAVAAFTILPPMLLPEDVTVPDVTDKELDEAIKDLENLGFVIEEPKEEISDEIEKGRVIRTNPKAGDEVKEGKAITIFVSLGKEEIEMDDYTGKNAEEAIRSLERLDFKVEISEEIHSEDVPAGDIVSQEPEAGQLVIPDETTVKFIVSKGASPINLDNYQGSSLDFAKRHLNSLGLGEPEITEEYHDSVHEGNIIKQEPGPDSEVQRGDSIKLTVSKGPQPGDKSVDIPLEVKYDPEEEGAEQTVEVYVEDLNQRMDEGPIENIVITDDLIYSFTVTIAYKQSARYRVVVDGKEVENVTLDYDDID
ncbi:Stk1 family PASTA domain-containing Ser/Thr kinase [Sutcliffiella rhizosphaerae]|uniref:non-specific serine/threonine protein kinase n=1 Tax=Sutcliffiella rhizosphaerae TaxID=2880967 RepID=A0ABM8YIX5_9BACI|nr:Stk1 family PASTA domain-containing Ser/Thr kinase [Sutcliffiella rhizosphaerae]CAG9619755.1 Serine/threonine-protein kinase PrkC [Sutcliffiella rhizosphaerae]